MSLVGKVESASEVTLEASEEREFSIRAIVTGVALGLVFAIANLYLALKFSITASASIPVAVLGIAAFSLARRLAGTAPGTQKEYTTVQTIGSVGESLAYTVGLAVPVFALLHVPLERWQVFLATCGGGLVGCLVLVPFRRTVRDGVFPEGRACASIIEAATTRARDVIRPLLRGLSAAAGYAVIRPFTATMRPSLQLDLTPELLGIGYLIETKAAVTLGCGGVAAWCVLNANKEMLDLSRQSFAFLAAGAIATSAGIQIVRHWTRPRPGPARPSMAGVDAGFRDLHPTFVWIVAAASLLLAFGAVAAPLDVPALWLGLMVVVAGVLSIVFVRFSASVAGKIGSSANPISAVALISAMAAAALAGGLPGAGRRDAVVLTVALIVAMAATCAGMTAQVLKTSEILRATPRKQEIGVIIGTITSSVALALSLPYLHAWMTTPGPTTRLLRDIVVSGTSERIEWSFVAAGAVITVLLEVLGVSSFVFAVGMYLNVSSALPIAAGGIVHWASERRVMAGEEDERLARRESFSLFAAGIIAGGVIVGVIVSILARSLGYGSADSPLTLLLFVVLGLVFVKLPR